MPILSLAVFIEAEEDSKAQILNDLSNYNYDGKEQEEILESINIYNKSLFDGINECLENIKPQKGKGMPNILERMSQMNNVQRNRGVVYKNKDELVKKITEMLSEQKNNSVNLVHDENKTEEQIDTIVTEEVQNQCTNLNWGQFESITKIEIADEIIKVLVGEAVDDIVKINV